MAATDTTDERIETQEPIEEPVEERAIPLELFFDLVFVFAFTQVTGLIREPDLGGARPGDARAERPCGGRGAPTRG